MSVTRHIALRHLKSRHTFGFISFATLLSVLGLMLGVAFLNLTAAFSGGFARTIEKKLSALDGHLRILKYTRMADMPLAVSDIETIRTHLDSLPFIQSLTPYVEKRGMARLASQSEGLIIYGVPDFATTDLFHLESFLTEGEATLGDSSSIIIGNGLAELLEAKVGSELILFDLDRFVREQLLMATRVTVSGIIHTGFAEYDRLLAFVPLTSAQKIFDMPNQFSGVISQVDEPDRIATLDRLIIDALSPAPYITSTWRERHATLFAWLDVYNIPLQLVIIFITLVAVFNLGSTLWMIIREKTRDIGILRAIGFSSRQIQLLFFWEGLIIGASGAIAGAFISILLLLLQSKFKIITLSSNVYFMDYLPVEWHWRHLFMYPLAGFVLALIATAIPCWRSRRLSPAEAVRYE